MLQVLAHGMVIAGAALLIAALGPVRRLMAQLPAGGVRSRWRVLGTLIAVFILGYAGYLAVFWGTASTPARLIVPAIFLLGGCFVWLTARLALLTAEDLRRVSRLEQENVTDPLTGIANRRHMERRLKEEFGRAKRYGLPLTVLLLDIDHFKHINDRLGHPAGDAMLRALAQTTRASLRESDFVARYGGEELLIIAPGSQTRDTTAFAERIRRAIEAQVFDHDGERVPLTVSIGAAALGRNVDSVEALVKTADEALYRAKALGRNRVFVAP